MFIQSKSTIGKLEVWHFSDAEKQHSFSVIPENGAMLTDVTIKGVSVLDGYKSAAEVSENAHYKSCILAPFPNRLADGRFDFEGKTYQFPVNDVDTQNALHGFVFDKPFQAIIPFCHANGAQLSLQYSYDGHLSYFPFPFELTVIYALHTQTGFHVTLHLQNTGVTNMPAGLGWHPYFRLDAAIDETLLQLPNVQKNHVNERLLPTGKTSLFEAFTEKKLIGKLNLDACFLIKEATTIAQIFLETKSQQLRFWQHIGDKKNKPWLAHPPNTNTPQNLKGQQFNYVQLYIPPDRSSIAIEPTTCAINAFNTGAGLSILKPTEILKITCGFELNDF